MYERNYRDSVLQEDKRSPNPPTGGRAKKKKSFSWKTFFLIFGCVVIVGGFVTLTQLTALQVTTVTVEGVDSADPKDVSEFVQADLLGSWLYVFPKTSIVLLPDRALQKSIKRAFPKFSEVSVMRSGTSTVTVSVTEYKGVYLWCETTESCSFMSKEGVVFAPAPFFSGSAYVKIFGGEKRDYPFAPISEKNLSTITFMTDRLDAINIEAAEFHFAARPDILTIVFYHNGGPAKIIIDLEYPLDTSLGALFTAIRTPALFNKFKDGVSIIEHIDVRIPNKVVYKLQ